MSLSVSQKGKQYREPSENIKIEHNQSKFKNWLVLSLKTGWFEIDWEIKFCEIVWGKHYFSLKIRNP